MSAPTAKRPLRATKTPLASQDRPHQRRRTQAPKKPPVLTQEQHASLLRFLRAKSVGDEGSELLKEGQHAAQIRDAVEARVCGASPFLWVDAEDPSAPFQWTDGISGPAKACLLLLESPDGPPAAVAPHLEIATVPNLRVCLESVVLRQLRNGDSGIEFREGALVAAAEASLLDAVDESKRVELRKRVQDLWPGALKDLWKFHHAGRVHVCTRYRGHLDHLLHRFLLKRPPGAFFSVPPFDVHGTVDQNEVTASVFQHLREKGWGVLSGCGGAGKSYILGQMARALSDATVPNEYLRVVECPLCKAPLNKTCSCGFVRPSTPLRSLRIVFAAPTNRAVSVLQSLVEKHGRLGAPTLCCTLHALGCMRHEVPVDLLVLDESSMLSSEHGDIVVRCNALRKTSLLLVGDDMQLLPVGSGEIFRPLLRQARLPCLLKNLRARDSLQEPLLAIRGGQASRASAFAATAANETDRHARVFEEILASSGTCQVLALRNEDRVNYCSFAIKKQHAAVEDDFSMGKPHPVAFKPYVGEPVRFQKNTCKPQACRGMLGVVTSVAEDASVPEASERGPFKKIYDVEVLVAPDAPPVKLRGTPLALGFELRPAFAITVHDSQGGEFDHVHVLMPPSPSSPLCTLEMLYTAASRARCTLKFWCVARPFQAYEEAFAKVSDARVTPLKATLRSLREA
jgi:hypothetical protein